MQFFKEAGGGGGGEKEDHHRLNRSNKNGFFGFSVFLSFFLSSSTSKLLEKKTRQSSKYNLRIYKRKRCLTWMKEERFRDSINDFLPAGAPTTINHQKLPSSPSSNQPSTSYVIKESLLILWRKLERVNRRKKKRKVVSRRKASKQNNNNNK